MDKLVAIFTATRRFWCRRCVDQMVARFSEVDIGNINERPAIWADTVRIVKDFWLTGTG